MSVRPPPSAQGPEQRRRATLALAYALARRRVLRARAPWPAAAPGLPAERLAFLCALCDARRRHVTRGGSEALPRGVAASLGGRRAAEGLAQDVASLAAVAGGPALAELAAQLAARCARLDAVGGGHEVLAEREELTRALRHLCRHPSCAVAALESAATAALDVCGGATCRRPDEAWGPLSLADELSAACSSAHALWRGVAAEEQQRAARALETLAQSLGDAATSAVWHAHALMLGSLARSVSSVARVLH
eukprot:m51a1_g7884 hypothetical protein (250) ;mRNA; r:60204-61352